MLSILYVILRVLCGAVIISAYVHMVVRNWGSAGVCGNISVVIGNYILEVGMLDFSQFRYLRTQDDIERCRSFTSM